MGLRDLFKRGRRRKEPDRETIAYAKVMGLNWAGRNSRQATLKSSPTNLRFFSRTPYARRAINAIKNPIAMLQWEVVPDMDAPNSRLLEKQCDVVSECLGHPNNDDSFRTLVEQLVEDVLSVGAGAVEQQVSGDALRPLWMWPVDGQSIQIYAAWTGQKNEARYVQTAGYGNVGAVEGRQLRNDELIYIRPNPSSATPYGYGPLEIAFNTISRKIGVSDYAGNVATNAQPENLLWLPGADPEAIRAFQLFWRNEIEGQGKTPAIGGDIEPNAVRLHLGNDDALYLKYQEFLLREIAAAFDLSPQNLGLESDVNRNTSEVAEDRDWSNAIAPLARLIESHINREAIHGRLGFSQISFRFIGLDREDEKATADIYALYYKNNAIIPNEQRERLGLPPLTSAWADMTYTDAQIAERAAAGAKQVDPDLTEEE